MTCNVLTWQDEGQFVTSSSSGFITQASVSSKSLLSNITTSTIESLTSVVQVENTALRCLSDTHARLGVGSRERFEPRRIVSEPPKFALDQKVSDGFAHFLSTSRILSEATQPLELTTKKKKRRGGKAVMESPPEPVVLNWSTLKQKFEGPEGLLRATNA